MSSSAELGTRSLSRRSRLAGLAASAAYTALGKADEASPTNAAKTIELFDGQSLAGWHVNSEKSLHGPGGGWSVENGVLIGQQDPPGSGKGGLLLSDQKFADFELSIDMRPDWGIDSGVFFRCNEQASGFQMYVDHHDNGNVGHLRGEMPGSFAIMPFQFTGNLAKDRSLVSYSTHTDPRALKWPEGVYEYSCSPETWLKTWRVNQWNTARIRCVGKFPQITTWINGVKICHFNGETSTLPGYDKQKVFSILGRSGSIGLQVHGGKQWPKGLVCRWKNIRIQEV
ncbi:DUF1080 domain-containing protein [Blastopirellula sp. JC732]|uniref:DUF1080 domain-containing protein n=1 Tax=Blastopirellula sediminis TaxID=2894196 RepID=A0A9X1MRZ7_9BACT|nr:DUF1080 domain-containing protein [Blastopirellula sediminis]MCC9606172.1 DUF1080 domain-containing protein [Blastopirellula sediminis]MCC9630529.1 DUF1080 domain-containing protein [Blastopirellula sediminis]